MKTVSAFIAALTLGSITGPLWTPPKEPLVLRDLDSVYLTNSGDKYHRFSCRYLKKSKIEVERKDAIAKGKTACKVCKP